ncbi:hypothetical protein CYMTET_37444 [Cymbomonas tetramitiformis]|uniref:RING-type domain-containing protein n=1 Tax=Cymbomonas tetramitiformis TaxID=36881 RepID=A0AAE0CGA9_9CHLO|nr:hypothetical protein CYMTET_37444 [Cymbomonas tetramitiformis]
MSKHQVDEHDDEDSAARGRKKTSSQQTTTRGTAEASSSSCTRCAPQGSRQPETQSTSTSQTQLEEDEELARRLQRELAMEDLQQSAERAAPPPARPILMFRCLCPACSNLVQFPESADTSHGVQCGVCHFLFHPPPCQSRNAPITFFQPLPSLGSQPHPRRRSAFRRGIPTDSQNTMVGVRTNGQVILMPLSELMDLVTRAQEQNGPPSASEAQIADLPTRSLSANEVTKGMEESEMTDRSTCAICLSQYEQNEEVKTLPCFHLYHAECIDPWLRHNGSCPFWEEEGGARVSAISGQKIKMKVKKTSEDKQRDSNRGDLLKWLNASYED